MVARLQRQIDTRPSRDLPNHLISMRRASRALHHAAPRDASEFARRCAGKKFDCEKLWHNRPEFMACRFVGL
jgi:hypothetical protein